MAPRFGTHTKNTTVTKLRGGSIELQYSSKVGIRDILVFLICLMCWGGQEARLILFYKIINSLAQVPFEGVLLEAYKGTRRKHSMKFRQIGRTTSHTTSQYGQSFFLKLLVHGTGLLKLKLHHWQYLDQLLLKISVHPFRHNTLEGSCGILTYLLLVVQRHLVGS